LGGDDEFGGLGGGRRVIYGGETGRDDGEVEVESLGFGVVGVRGEEGEDGVDWLNWVEE
jgi:hypothetical protein